MKKIALTAAVLAVFSGAAFAQSNVTIYGIVDANITYDDNGGPAGSAVRLDSGGQSGSRIGFRGTEDLGGGLSASFVLENGFNVDSGTLAQGGLFLGRQAWVGLDGGFGSVKMGRQYNAIFHALAGLDPFGIALAGDSTRLFTHYGYRMNNTMTYTTPKLGPVSAQLLYGFGETAGNSSANRQLGLTAAYSSGPIMLTLVHHKAENATGTDDAKTTIAGGTYDFSIAKAHLAYAVNKGVGTLDTRDTLLGVTVPFGKTTVLASYIRKDDKAVADADADQIALGVSYELSKRTNFYSSFSRLSNDRLASYAAGAPGATAKLFNVGIRHKF
jgi:predicted porin